MDPRGAREPTRLLSAAALAVGLLVVGSVARADHASPAHDPTVGSSSGLLTMEFPIEVPIGTGGLQPPLKLRYASTASDGPFGVGWGIELGEIRRSTRFGIPAYDNYADTYELDGQLLVRDFANRFHTEVESFALIKLFPTPDRWEVTLTNGTRAKYGSTAASRIQSGFGTNRTFRWLLDELVDANGNTVRLIYHTPTDPGTLYLDRIEYSYRGGAPVGELRKVQFLYEPRPDPIDDFTAGVQARITQRVKEIYSQVGSQPFRRYILRYNEGSYSTGRSRLTSIERRGSDCAGGGSTTGCAAFPVQTFSYNDPTDTLGAGGTSTNWVSSSTTYQAPVPFTQKGTTADPAGKSLGVLAGDVDGDGLVDLVKAYEDANGALTHQVYLNTGAGWQLSSGSGSWSDALAALQFTSYKVIVNVNGAQTDVTSVDTSQAVTSKILFATARDWTNESPVRHYVPPVLARLVDLNGDGRADLYVSKVLGPAQLDCAASCTSVPGTHVRAVWLNTGSGWALDTALSSTLPPLGATFVYERTSGNLGLHEAIHRRTSRYSRTTKPFSRTTRTSSSSRT